jgi:cytochrome oxidase assembly protein ShyY1
VVAAFTRLGFWQWQRGVEKAQTQVELAALVDAPPRSLNEALALPRPRLQRIEVDGVLQAPVLLLDNQLRDGRAGVLVLNPLRIEGQPAELLVARGWLPLTDGVRGLPTVDRPAGQLRLAGFLDHPTAAGLSLGQAPAGQIADPLLVTRIDLGWLEARLQRPLLPWVLYLDPAAPAGFDRDWTPRSLPPQRHRGYAVQWWGLAVAVLLIYLVLAWRSRRRSRISANSSDSS